MKINKYILFFLGAVLLVSCCNSVSKSPEIDVDLVKIKYVGFFTIDTFMDIHCENFEWEFEKLYKEYVIEDKNTIAELISIFNNFELLNPAYAGIDTRAKIEMYSKNDTLLCCIGDLTLFFQNTFYKTPKSLLDFIEKNDTSRIHKR